MRKPALRWVLIGFGLLLAVVVALPLLVDANLFRPQLEDAMTSALGRPVKLGSLKLSILSGGVAADDLAIADDPAYSREPFVRAKSVRIGVELLPLIFSRKLNVTGISIVDPQIALIQSQSGAWNFGSLGGKTAPARAPGAASQIPDLSVKALKITGGRFSVARASGREKPLVLEHVTMEARDFSAASAFPLSLSGDVAGGGEIKLDGTAGPLNAGDLSRTPAKAKLKIAGFDLAGSGWTQAVPGMGGVVGIDGDLESDGATARVKGRVQADKLKLARNGTPASRAVALDFALEHHVAARSGRLSQGDIHIGNAVARLTGTYAAHGESTALHMNLAGPAMPLTELAAMLPAIGVALPAGSSLQGGTADVKLAMEGPAESLVTTGTLGLQNATLAGFDLGRRMAAVEMLAGIKGGSTTEIQSLAGNVRASNDGTAIDGLRLIVPAIGELSGAGSISPANALDFHMTARVHTGALLAKVSDEAVPFTVQGTCADPVFRPDVKSFVREKATSVGIKAAGGLLNGLLGGKK